MRPKLLGGLLAVWIGAAIEIDGLAYWAETDEVAAFEELVGSHGGMGGPQSHPFVLAPASLPLPAEPIVGAEAVHRVFRGWLAGLGHPAYEPT